MTHFWISLVIALVGPLLTLIAAVLEAKVKNVPITPIIMMGVSGLCTVAAGVMKASFQNPDGTPATTAWQKGEQDGS
jgi:hypothetical protein